MFNMVNMVFDYYFLLTEFFFNSNLAVRTKNCELKILNIPLLYSFRTICSQTEATRLSLLNTEVYLLVVQW